MSAARIDVDGRVYQLDGRATPEEVVTEDDVKDPAKLARFVGRLLAAVAALKREWRPRVAYFQDVATTGTAGVPVSHSFRHGFNGRVHWWVTDWDLYGDLSPILGRDDAATTSDTLVLTSYAAGTMTIRVEAVG